MFKEWGFLLGEIWVLLAIAAVLGLIAGWLIFGGARGDDIDAERLRGELEQERARLRDAESRVAALEASGGMEADLREQLDLCNDVRLAADARIEELEARLAEGGEARELTAQLQACAEARADAEAKLADLQMRLDEGASAQGDAEALRAELEVCSQARGAAEATIADLQARLDAPSEDFALQEALAEAQARTATLEADLAACQAQKAAALSAGAAAPATGAAGFVDVGSRPEGLTEARNGQPDDLQLIKGIGPKLEKLCNRLGFWHFDQVAAWTGDEVAWVDENLEGFKGRVTRDEWVEQAKVLAAGGAPRK